MWRVMRVFMMAVVLTAVVGCAPTEEEKFRALSQEINRLKVGTIDLEERIYDRDAEIESLTGQINNLRATGQVPTEPLFETQKIVILGITSGIDIDGRPGDDGVVVYFRPVDRDGDVLKRGGRIAAKLVDHTQPGRTRQVGLVELNDADSIRRAWYGKFWTNHFKVVVPFSTGFEPRPGQEIGVWVEFIEVASGRPFTATTTIQIKAVRAEKNRGG